MYAAGWLPFDGVEHYVLPGGARWVALCGATFDAMLTTDGISVRVAIPDGDADRRCAVCQAAAARPRRT